MIPRVLSSKVPHFVSTGNPTLEVIAYSRSAITLTINILTSTGVFTRSQLLTAALAQNTITIPVSEIPTGLIIIPSGTVRDGDLYIRVAFIAGGVTTSLLTTGYCSSLRPLSWPPGIIQSQLKQNGNIFTVTPADPAAGADWVYTIPTSARYRILHIRVALATVGANTPLVSLTVTVDAINIVRFTSPLVQPAAATRTYEFIALSNKNDIAFNANLEIELSIPPLELPEASVLTLSGQDGDDNWQAGSILVEALIE